MGRKEQYEKLTTGFDIAVSTGIKTILKQASEKEYTVNTSHSAPFSTEDLKQLLSENFIVVTNTLSSTTNINQQFIMNASTAAYLSDLIMMGDGNVSYDSNIHLDGIKEFFNQVLGNAIAITQQEAGLTLENKALSVAEVSLMDGNWNQTDFSFYTLNIKDPETDDFRTILHLVQNIEGPTEKNVSQKDDSSEADTVKKDLGILLDISLPIVIELGRTEMLMGDILELGPGSVVELDKLSGDYVDIYVNDKKFAKGEVVVIDDNFGVRIMELLSPQERLNQLK